MFDYTKCYICSGSMRSEQSDIDLYQQYAEVGVDVLKTIPFDFTQNKEREFLFEVTESTALAKTFGLPVVGCVGPSRIRLSSISVVTMKTYAESVRSDLKRFYKRLFQIYRKLNVNAILIETVVDTLNLELILSCTDELPLPVFVTLTPTEDGTLLCGRNVLYALSMCAAFKVDAVGYNCITAGRCLRMLKRFPIQQPVICNPCYSKNFVDEFKILKSYCFMLGGCCGVTPQILSKAL